MAYEIDRTDDMWSLADYVEKGIEVLDNDNGFFMMCEAARLTGPATPTMPLPPSMM